MSERPVIALIAAVAANGIIGAGGAMPWRLATDLRRFKQLTTGKPVIMGRPTFEAIGRPLPNRVNIVVTRRRGRRAEGVLVAADVDAAIGLARDAAAKTGAGEVMVIGGGEIYAQTIGRADRLYITHVDMRPDGDTSFPAIDPGLWAAGPDETVPAGPNDSAATRFVIYRRVFNE